MSAIPHELRKAARRLPAGKTIKAGVRSCGLTCSPFLYQSDAERGFFRCYHPLQYFLGQRRSNMSVWQGIFSGDCVPKVVELEGAAYSVMIEVGDDLPPMGASRNASTGGEKLVGMLERRLPMESLTKMVAQLAESFSESLAQIEHKPSTVEISFGLEASGELGNFLITKIAGKTNFGVKMTWKSD